MNFVNEIMIRGKVLVIRNGDKPSIRILSKSGNKESFPLVFCSKKTLSSAKIRTGMHVEIKGRVQSYTRKENDRYTRHQVFFATSVKQDETLCGEKFAIKGKFYNEFQTAVYLSGAFVSEEERGNGWLHISIRVSDKANDIVVVNMRKLDRQPKYKKGDPICVVGSISTINKDFNGEKVHYENIVVKDIG